MRGIDVEWEIESVPGVGSNATAAPVATTLRARSARESDGMWFGGMWFSPARHSGSTAYRLVKSPTTLTCRTCPDSTSHMRIRTSKPRSGTG